VTADSYLLIKNTALFSLLGTQFGGDGTTNFALPDLRGAVPVGAGGAGLKEWDVGHRGSEVVGTQTVTYLAPGP